MPYMYLLRCSDGSSYVGSAWDLDVRLAQHQAGEGAAYTRRRLPVELAYAEWFDRVDEAYAAELQVKGWGRRKRELLIAHGLEGLKGSGSRSTTARQAWSRDERGLRDGRGAASSGNEASAG